MPSTAIVWLRRDLRVHDHPPLVAALAAHDRVVPAFVLDPILLRGRFVAGPRTAFLLDCLRELDGALRERGSGLVVRHGCAEREIPVLADAVNAQAVYWASDATPYALARDRRVRDALRQADIEAVPGPGNFVADVGRPRTNAGRPFTVFTPFHRAWSALERRTVHRAPSKLPVLPHGLDRGELPRLADLDLGSAGADELTAPAVSAGEAAATTASPAALRACRRTCASARSRRARSRSGRAGTAVPEPPPSPASSPGVTSTPTCSFTIPAIASTSIRSACAPWSGTRTRSC